MSKLLPDATRAEWRADAMRRIELCPFGEACTGEACPLERRILALLDHIGELTALMPRMLPPTVRGPLVLEDDAAISQSAPTSSQTSSSPDRRDANE